VITDNAPGTANGAVTYTFQFSEPVAGFDLTDVAVTGAPGATVGTFVAVDADTYTAVVTPPAGSGSFTVGVAAGAALDAAGNPSVAATSSAQPYDIPLALPPV
jgi:hypothetical protein